MPSTVPSSAAALFKALGDPTRLQLLYLIANQRLCSNELSAATSVSPATITHHMKRLAEADLIQRVREGKHTYYDVTQNFQLVDQLIRALESNYNPAT